MLPVLTPILGLILIAFFTLLERNILGYSQSRNGPNNVSFIGLLQPLADALNLFTNSPSTNAGCNHAGIKTSSCLAIFLALCLWSLIPTNYPITSLPHSAILIITFIALNVYWVLGAGWSSNSNYSLLGALRSVAQTISYEIPIAISMLLLLLTATSLSLNDFLETSPLFVLLYPMTFIIWLFTVLAETSRAPFDHAESESELVSGFNTEYEGGQFALLFISEYINILFLSIITPIIFCGFNIYLDLFLGLLLAATLIWIRATVPRLRYDVLIELAWKSALPISIIILFLVYPLI